jgi:hypothetical protein
VIQLHDSDVIQLRVIRLHVIQLHDSDVIQLHVLQLRVVQLHASRGYTVSNRCHFEILPKLLKDVGSYETQLLLYNEKRATSKVFLQDATMVHALPILFFGGEITVSHEENWLAVGADKWIKFQAPAREAVLVKQLRKGVVLFPP